MRKDDPVAIAKQLRSQRRVATQIVKGAVAVVCVTFPVLLFQDAIGIPSAIENWFLIPAVAAFFVAWFAMAFLSVNRARDMRNRFRPGSAQAYEDE